ncbi:TPA: hypothetical protein ACUWRH_002123 [Listeria monocytogenes]|uniref:hypothetical protein n=2 Tax=Listeria monocytogenes TaxID=1639 RepID=UPI000A9AF3B6|nr:hypothetical protein [Listeria monocytogenes]MDV2956500.1 hypothetical protein [Listeria monocytogenes]RJZ34758.1 ESAT-6 secretion machinery protein EssD [Listeria monocytogenes]RKC89120.1 ESAT-6 secretion machinery protein EssD [Listeria monocytogenes]CAB3444044.1 hypothetical protein GCONFFOG_01747 [Listeria monocytogenes]
MKEVNYREDDWREAKSALAPFAAANWVGGLFNNLEKVSKNMEEAEEDIQELDSDHAISFQHTNYRGKYSAIEDDLMVLYKFSCHAGEKMETLVDQPFYEKLDAFVDGMQDLSISTYSTTNRIGAKSKQTYTTTSGGSQVIESIKEGATIEDLMNGDNFYANQMQLQYRDWQRANPDQDVSKKDFQMGMLHSRAFEYKSIKDEQQEKEFWVNIVATVVIVGVSIFCPPAGLALAVGYGSLEAGSAISGKDWVSGRELSTEERALRGGLALLDIVPGVKALSTGAKAASAGSKLVRVGDNVLAGSKNVGKGTIDNGIQAGKQAMDLRLANAKKVSEAVQKKLTKDLDDIGTMAKTIQNKTKETFTLPSREQLAFAGGGSIPEQSAAGAASIAAKKKLKDMMQNMDNLNVKGGGKAGIIEETGAAKYRTKIDDKVIEVDREILPDFIKDSFLDGNYRTVKTTEEITVYRVFGGNAKSTGSFVTSEKAISRIDAKIDMALLPGWKNTRMYEAEIIIPKGQQINIGKVAPQAIESTGTILKGGVDQIVLPRNWSSDWIINIKSVPNK